jgi:methionine-rich copper-binding protein CopC
MKVSKVVGAATAVILLSGTAFGHPIPKSSLPKPNAVLTVSPTEIRISFSEGLELTFSGIELDGAAGKKIPTSTPALNPNDSRELIVPLSTTLAPGAYTVKWHAVGDDTHRVAGQYSFHVK